MIKNNEENELFDLSTSYLLQVEKAIFEAEENVRKLRLTRANVMREILGQDPTKRQIPVADRPPAPQPPEQGKPPAPQSKEKSFLHKNQPPSPIQDEEISLESELAEELKKELSTKK